MKSKVQKPKESKEVDQLKNQLVRVLADYDNLRKRVEIEREVWEKYAAERVLMKFISVLDILEDAQKNIKDQGLAIAIEEFKKVLEDENIERISPSQGDGFDPKVHEAIEVVSGGEKGKIAELTLVGWKFKDGKIIRPAKVKVYGKEDIK